PPSRAGVVRRQFGSLLETMPPPARRRARESAQPRRSRVARPLQSAAAAPEGCSRYPRRTREREREGAAWRRATIPARRRTARPPPATTAGARRCGASTPPAWRRSWRRCAPWWAPWPGTPPARSGARPCSTPCTRSAARPEPTASASSATSPPPGRPCSARARASRPCAASSIASTPRPGPRWPGRTDLPPLEESLLTPTPAGARVLVVDDDPDVLIFVRQVLTHSGFEVHTAGDGRLAVDRAGAGPLG